MAGKRPRADEATHEAVVEAWVATFPSIHTRSAYRADLKLFGRWCALNGSIAVHAETADVVAFQAARAAAGDSDATLRRRSSSLSSFYDFAVSARLTAANPVTGSNRPVAARDDVSPTPVLSAAAVDAYLEVARTSDPRLHALVALLVLDGLKVAEMLAIDVDDVRCRPTKVTVALHRHGGSSRIELTPRSAGAVLRCAAGRAGQPLFVARPQSADTTPRRLTRFGADHLIRRLEPNRGVVTANVLRRFHINASHAAGVEFDAIRARTGLADARSLMRYFPLDVAGAPSMRRPRRGPAKSRLPASILEQPGGLAT